MSYSVGSLFAGIGGICEGFKQAGFSIKWANEVDSNACKTYQFNYPDHKLHHCDIQSIENPELLGKVDVITSGFPCQAFSIAGHRKGFSDHRGNLFFETARFIDELRPKAFLLENVRNLKGHDNGRTYETIKGVILNDLGYSFQSFVLNAKDYGNIPQTRERIYIVGFKDKDLANEFEIPGKVKLTKNIHQLVDSDQKDPKYYYSSDHQYYPELTNTVKSRDTFYQWRRVYVRENKSNVCPTLTANMGTGGHNVPIIQDNFGIRKLTPKECVNFQGFPQKFKFPVEMANSHCYKQAGNSVVVPVIKRIAKEIVRVLELG